MLVCYITSVASSGHTLAPCFSLNPAADSTALRQHLLGRSLPAGHLCRCPLKQHTLLREIAGFSFKKGTLFSSQTSHAFPPAVTLWRNFLPGF